eukprot:4950645-Prymnesium_polylepis.1
MGGHVKSEPQFSSRRFEAPLRPRWRPRAGAANACPWTMPCACLLCMLANNQWIARVTRVSPAHKLEPSCVPPQHEGV